MPTPIDNDIPSQTISTALKHGWRWKIPLTSRYGNGYVYSSAFCTADDAEHELREGLGVLDSETPARHLKMKIGRVTKHWNKNCLAVGLAQGFIEPLEATALLFIQRTGTSIVADVGRQAIGKGYPVFSWYCIMSGMGVFPDQKDLRPATAAENRYSMEEIDNLLQRSAQNFGSQREVLTNIPKKVEERSLQIYFW